VHAGVVEVVKRRDDMRGAGVRLHAYGAVATAADDRADTCHRGWRRAGSHVPAVFRAPWSGAVRACRGVAVSAAPAVSCAVIALPGPDARAWLESVRQLEDEGWSTLLLPDTLRTPSPFPALAAAAAVTTRLRLRTWVLAAPMRSAAVVVREAAALQQLSGDRFELGIGAGRPDAEAEAARLGLRWGTAAERIGQVQEVADTVRREMDPAPTIVVTAAGDRMLTAAARVADRIGLAAPPTATAGDLAAMALRARAAVAHAGGGREVGLTQQLVGMGDRLPTWLVRSGLDAVALAEAGAVGLLRGAPEDMTAVLLERRNRWGIDEVVVPGEVTDAFVPVLRSLSRSGSAAP
jgi:alkanesulfonate monooxygenase SsuD/methylene tetrahydromethanopterin reductase-like flavin-dependent oxidoreductase (luciferase family)